VSAATDNARRLAEDAFAYTPLWPAAEREEREQYVLSCAEPAPPVWLALRLRAGADVETIADEVRAWFAGVRTAHSYDGRRRVPGPSPSP
jgi:hypothetical protein